MVISFSRGPVIIHQAHVLLRYGKSLFTCLSFLLMCVAYIVSSCCLVLSFKCNVLYRVVVFSPFFFSARISSGFFTYDFGFSPFDCFKLKLSTLRTNLDNFSDLFSLWWNHANLQYHSPKMVPIVYNLSVFIFWKRYGSQFYNTRGYNQSVLHCNIQMLLKADYITKYITIYGAIQIINH